MHETYIIDAYNLLHRGIGLRQGGRDLFSDRSRLEILLREFLRAQSTCRVVLVYDGAHDVDERGTRSRAPTEGLDIIYAKPPESADARVLSECVRRRGAERLVVVTSDVKDIVRQLPAGVRHVPSESFVDLLEAALEGPTDEPESDARCDSEKPTDVTESEVDEWLRRFTDDG